MEVIRVVHILSLDTVTSTDGPIFIVDGSPAEMKGKAEGDVLEAQLVRKFTGGGVSTTDYLVETSAELGLARGGGCGWKCDEIFVIGVMACLLCYISEKKT